MIKVLVTEMPGNCRACPISQGTICNLTKETNPNSDACRGAHCPLAIDMYATVQPHSLASEESHRQLEAEMTRFINISRKEPTGHVTLNQECLEHWYNLLTGGQL